MPEENVQVIYPVVELVDDQPITTSLNIAEVFGKPHKHVLSSIEKIDVPEEFSRTNFWPSDYTDPRGKKQPLYKIARDGFMLLVMGYTGKQAMRFKIAYIEAFNRMEKALSVKEREVPDVKPSIPVISREVLQRVRETVEGIKISDRVKLLHSACQMNRIDQSLQPTRESILRDFADLCSAFASHQGESFESKTFRDFLSDCCCFAPNQKVGATEIYQRFVDWYQCNIGGPAPSGTWFGRMLSAMKLQKLKSNGCVVYWGIFLKAQGGENE